MTDDRSPLRSFVEETSRRIERVFLKNGKIDQFWHIVFADGEEHVMPSPSPNKNTAVAMMRSLFERRPVRRYILVGEAWTVEARSDEHLTHVINEAARRDISDHPDRKEVIVFAAEDARFGLMMAQRTIERPSDGKPYLGPLKFSDSRHLAGRMVALLPRKEALQ
jgi:hypothetical protein